MDKPILGTACSYLFLQVIVFIQELSVIATAASFLLNRLARPLVHQAGSHHPQELSPTFATHLADVALKIW